MTASRQPNQDKSSKYAIAASKGFSYYLPKTAQQDLQTVLKQLPSPARSIYNEYYRDLMSAKACAPESAGAMATFVTESFPMVAKLHNAFVRKMNEEIRSNQHEGYVPVMFPVVRKLKARVEESAREVGRSKKRKHATPSSARSTSRENPPNKKTKVKANAQPSAMLGLGADSLSSPSPTKGPNADILSSLQRPSDGNNPSTDTIKHQGITPRTPDSIHSIDPKHATSPAHLHQHSQAISPPNTDPSTPDTTTASEHPLQSAHAQDTTPKNPHPTTPTTSAPHTPHPQDPQDDTFFSEEQSWRQGLEAIEAFSWTGRGSWWVAGRGRVSVYYNDMDGQGGGSAALFPGDYWDGGGGTGGL